MANPQLDTIAQALSRLTSRRAAVRAAGGGGVGAALAAWCLDAEARKKKKKGKGKGKGKGKKKCQAPKGKCGKSCVPLNTPDNCGSCGNRCAGDEICAGGECGPAPEPARPFPFHQDYGAIQPAAASANDVERAYDRWKQRYLVAVGANQYRVAFGKNNPAHKQTVSEGQGFGMMIVAHMAGYDPNAKTIFDGLWRFVRAHPSEVDDRLMDWKVPESKFGDDSAFDGDADIAYGLLLADRQWGSAGAIDYVVAFESVLAGIKASTIGNQSKLPMLGDWVGQNSAGEEYNQFTPRTSDFMPGHFRAFGRKDNAGFWNDVVDACVDVIDDLQALPNTVGLLPDFAVRNAQSSYVPAPAGFLEGKTDGDYSYNACRDPWRLGVSALLNGDDAKSKQQAVKISKWADNKTQGVPSQFMAGYTLAGNALIDYWSTAFVAPLGVAAMNDPSAQSWLDAIYSAVRVKQDDYYEDSITLLCLLAMTGNFWDPTQQ